MSEISVFRHFLSLHFAGAKEVLHCVFECVLRLAHREKEARSRERRAPTPPMRPFHQRHRRMIVLIIWIGLEGCGGECIPVLDHKRAGGCGEQTGVKKTLLLPPCLRARLYPNGQRCVCANFK